MKRRSFIKFTAITLILFSANIVVARSIKKNNFLILKDILNIIFPKTLTMPSAEEFKALEYLVKNISHKTFDDEDKILIIDGTEDFIKAFPDFLNLKKDEKKELIFEIVKNNQYAKSWISKLSYYGIEAMFSDSIYDGNYNQIGWKSVNHFIGFPRPLKTYGQKV